MTENVENEDEIEQLTAAARSLNGMTMRMVKIPNVMMSSYHINPKNV